MRKYTTIIVSRDEKTRVDTVTLNVPQKLNALSPKMVDELLWYFKPGTLYANVCYDQKVKKNGNWGF